MLEFKRALANLEKAKGLVIDIDIEQRRLLTIFHRFLNWWRKKYKHGLFVKVK
jgi:hypothetical protein